MRAVVFFFALGLVVFPLMGGGAGGGDPATGCAASCALCFVNTPCCGDAICTLATSDGLPRCKTTQDTCKLAP